MRKTRFWLIKRWGLARIAIIIYLDDHGTAFDPQSLRQ
jgi:hypothetical protein